MALHLYEHPIGGFYAAETIEEARALIIKDTGDDAEGEELEEVPDDRMLTIYDEQGANPETKTALAWAATSNHKGYQFGGDV